MATTSESPTPAISWLRRVCIAACLGFAIAAVLACRPAVMQQAWISNESGVPVIVVTEGQLNIAVGPGVSGLAYSETGQPTPRRISVLADDCSSIASTTNEQYTLLIIVTSGGSVEFQQGANLSPLNGEELKVTERCQ
jgi:hypothetical protein